jgi:hypothetical protein
MQNFFRIIKRKRNLRRLSAVWLLLIAIELLCPLLGDEKAFAAEMVPSKTEIAAKSTVPNESGKPAASVSDNSENKSNFHQSASVCYDDCLCHATAIVHFSNLTIKSPFFRSEQIVSSVNRVVSNSLPPPYIPPKNS